MSLKVTILGPAYPYRGGLASIMETLARTFNKRGDAAEVLTFTVQYPSLLFPGKSQYRDGEPPKMSRLRAASAPSTRSTGLRWDSSSAARLPTCWC